MLRLDAAIADLHPEFMLSGLLGALIWTCLQAAPHSSAPGSSPSDAERIAEAMRALARAHDACDWPAVVARAGEARGIAPRGSEAWFEACAREVAAQNELWAPEALEVIAREALDELARVRRLKPDAKRSALGPLHPRAAGYVIGLEINLAHVLQSRGLHVEALGHQRLVMDDLATGECLGAAGLMAEAGLDAARSLLILGRSTEAHVALTSLRDTFRGSRQAASASVLLQSGREGLDAYRGKYEGDEDQTHRMRKLLAVVPRARSRVAAQLGFSLESLPDFPVGFVDLPSDMRQMGALTEADARRPAIVPVVLVFNETLALDMLDMENVLVHELTHAALISACGSAYHRLPPWIVEGLSEAVAGQTAGNMDFWLANRLSVDPRGFASPQFWKSSSLVFDAGPCQVAPTQEAGLAILPLVERKGIEGVRRIVAELRSGKSLDEGLRAVIGLDVGDYLALAAERVRAELETRRTTAVITAHHLAIASEQGPGAVLKSAEEGIQDLPAGIALGLALWKRADSLGKLGRLEESLAAHRALLAARRAHPVYVELARMGEAGALLALGKATEARAALRALERDAMTSEVTQWAATQTTRLR